jgi:hypothetical protein
MTSGARQKNEQDAERAKVLIRCLDMSRIDYGLGLYAVLRILEQEAQCEDRLTQASIVSRDLFKTQQDRCPFESAIALLVNGELLGSFGEKGWQAICENASDEKDVSEYYAAASFKVVQYAHHALNWKGDEEEGVEKEIQAYVKRLKANLQAQDIQNQTAFATPVQSSMRSTRL